MTVKLGMTHAQLIDAINSDIDLIKDQGSKIITKEFPASETETSSVQLDTKCQGKDYMFVFMDYGILEPSKYSLSADGLTVNFSPAIPANHKIIIRYFTPGSSFTNYVTDEFQSNLLNYTTNRILEIPQDIKLELNNGTLTLKAGSKLYYPDGFESDGTTPKFDIRIIENNVSNTASFNIQHSMMYQPSLGSFAHFVQGSNLFSGSTDPTGVPTPSVNYNTTLNKIRFSGDGGSSWADVDYSLPFAITTSNSSQYTSIDQIFNGFGYIGSTVFALPGVKGEIPNGRNEDGTCKSTLTALASVKTQTFTDAAQRGWYLQPNGASSGNSPVYSDTQPSQNYIRWFSQKDNQWYDTHSSPELNSKTYILPLALFNTDSTGKITSFEPFTVDSVINSNASNFSQAGRSYLSGLGMPSNRYIYLTLGASGSTYTAPANGWFYFLGRWENAVPYLQMRNTTISGLEPRVQTCGASTTGYWGLYMPVRAGDRITINYNDAPVNVRLAFIYAQGDQ